MAAKWYRRAADQGNGEAQNNLGYLYMTGKGVHQDEAEALTLWRRAAAQGCTYAEQNLGVYARLQSTPIAVRVQTPPTYSYWPSGVPGQQRSFADREKSYWDQRNANQKAEQSRRPSSTKHSNNNRAGASGQRMQVSIHALSVRVIQTRSGGESPQDSAIAEKYRQLDSNETGRSE